MACQCFSWISSILALNPRGTISFRMCFLSDLPLFFESLQWLLVKWKYHDPGHLSKGGPYYRSPPAWWKARDLMSSSDNLEVDVMIQDIPWYHPICTLVNQLWSPLSTSTSMSLRLNSLDSLLALETFNKEDIFIYSPFRPKDFLYLVTRHKKCIFIPQIFLFLFFSSWGTHQSQYLDGCQAMGKSSSFIETFWAFHFL